MDENKNSRTVLLTKSEYEVLADKQARLNVLKEVFETCGYISDEVVRAILGVERKVVKADEN
jgi:phage pi2 protein 07